MKKLIWRKVYKGPHTKKIAQELVKSFIRGYKKERKYFEKECGLYDFKVKKDRNGWAVYCLTEKNL